MVETEGAVATKKPVIAEEPTGLVADYRIGAIAGGGAGVAIEQLVVAPQPRT
jgi:hypothetical protein